MTVTVTNLLMGPAELYVATFGATEPVNASTDPGVDWTNVGGTDGGATLTINQTYTPMNVDQIAMPVGARKTEQVLSVATSLAEATLANLRLAVNNYSGTGDTIELGAEVDNTDPEYVAFLLRGQKPGGGGRNVILRRALSTESIGMAWQKAGQTLIPVTMTGYYVSDAIKAIKIDDSAGV